MKLKIGFAISFFLSFLASGCGLVLPNLVTTFTVQANFSKPTQTLPIPTSTIWADPPDLAEILLISDIQSIQLKDDWSGLAMEAPAKAHYSLLPVKDEFSGQVLFQVGGYFRPPIVATGPIDIPMGNINRFIDILITAPLTKAGYTPEISHTDDYPYKEIDIQLSRETISFYSSSQGVSQTPWAVSIHNQTYTVNSDVPYRALAFLNPFLAQDAYRQLRDQVRNSLNPYGYTWTLP